MDQQAQSMAPMGQNGAQQVNPRKIFVGNLSWNLTSDDLREIFGEFGTVEEATVLTDKFSGRSKGFGFVTMSTEEEAQAAINGLNGKNVDGRDIVANIAQPPKERRPEDRHRSFGGGDRGGYQSRGGSNSRGGGFNQRRGGQRQDYQ